MTMIEQELRLSNGRGVNFAHPGNFGLSIVDSSNVNNEPKPRGSISLEILLLHHTIIFSSLLPEIPHNQSLPTL